MSTFNETMRRRKLGLPKTQSNKTVAKPQQDLAWIEALKLPEPQTPKAQVNDEVKEQQLSFIFTNDSKQWETDGLITRRDSGGWELTDIGVETAKRMQGARPLIATLLQERS